VPQSVWAAVIIWADLLADSWSLLTDCVRTGKPASQVRDPKIPSRWSQDAEADSIFRAVMGTAPAEDYAPIAEAWDFSRAKVVADLGGTQILPILILIKNAARTATSGLCGSRVRSALARKRATD